MNRLLLLFGCLAVYISPLTVQAANPIEILLNAHGAGKLIAEYTGIVESTDAKVDRLIGADLKTAVALLKQIEANPTKTADLLTDARVYFTRACEIEEEPTLGSMASRHRKAKALLGLWTCCTILKDDVNAKLALEAILRIPNGLTPELTIRYEASKNPATKPFFELSSLFNVREAIGYGTEYGYYLRVREAVDMAIDPKLLEAKYREFDSDYDGLLNIQASVKKKLKSQ